jgi:hypothetical protein
MREIAVARRSPRALKSRGLGALIGAWLSCSGALWSSETWAGTDEWTTDFFAASCARPTLDGLAACVEAWYQANVGALPGCTWVLDGTVGPFPYGSSEWLYYVNLRTTGSGP